ncbi:MAG: hypothetical protein K2H66_03295, partial [Oscillospiraceae bacterium]|nr:hypothetical protein [Oscillospiraceae bacterium]
LLFRYFSYFYYIISCQVLKIDLREKGAFALDSLLEILYYHWYTNKKQDTKEFRIVNDMLDENTFTTVFDCIIAETQQAFQAGFQTAVQLLVSGDKL